MEEGAEPLLDDAMPVPPAPAPIVWAIPAVALSASTAPAIIMVFMEASTFILKHRRAASPSPDAIEWLTRRLAGKLPATLRRRPTRYPRNMAKLQSSLTLRLRKEGFSTCLRRRMALGVTSTSSSSSM